MEFLDHPVLLIFVAILSFPIYKTLAKFFFGEEYEDLGECLKYVAQADWYSALRGRFWQDWDATMKFNFFIFLCLAWPISVTEGISRIFL